MVNNKEYMHGYTDKWYGLKSIAYIFYFKHSKKFEGGTMTFAKIQQKKRANLCFGRDTGHTVCFIISCMYVNMDENFKRYLFQNAFDNSLINV